MAETADVVVIGGGINGCSIAYHLAQKGVKKIVLVERRHIAGGPTGRSSGVIRTHYTLETLASMARDSLKVFQHFEEEIGGSAGYVETGVVFFVSEENATALRKSVEMHQRLGIRSSVLSVKELRTLDPYFHEEKVACGAYDPEATGY